jgi:hypothetical protein
MFEYKIGDLVTPWHNKLQPHTWYKHKGKVFTVTEIRQKNRDEQRGYSYPRSVVTVYCCKTWENPEMEYVFPEEHLTHVDMLRHV